MVPWPLRSLWIIEKNETFVEIKKIIPIIALTVFLSLVGLRAQELASQEHDTGNATYSSIVQVDTDTYAIAYAGVDNDGFIATFTISADGTSITEVASLEHETAKSLYNSLVQVDTDTYALAYTGNNNDGYIATFTISADGSSITKVDQLEHSTTNGEFNSLVKVDSDTYAVAYTGASDKGFIATFTIAADGDNITKVDQLQHSGRGKHNSLVQVDADTYALAYEGGQDDGFIATFTIAADGDNITEVDQLEHDNSEGGHNSLVQVDADTYVLAYKSNGGDGWITTFTIAADGDNITEVASEEHDSGKGQYNSLVQVDSDTYALAYKGGGDDGHIATFTISADGSSITEVASFEHDTDFGEYNSLVKVDSDTYALAYTSETNNSDGYIKTFTIQSDGSMGSTAISGDAGFRMLSSPLAGQIYSDLLDELWTQGMTGADDTNGDANVWTLSPAGSQSSSSWTALSDISGSGASLTAGHGFLVYVFPDTDNDGDDDLPVTLKISGTYNSSSATYGSVPDGNYALAGNPYPFTIDWDNVSKTNVTTVYVWDDASGGSGAYKSWNNGSGGLTNGLIAPLQGFLFLAVDGTGSITMEAADKSTSAGTFYRLMQNNTGSVGFNIVTADYTDQTFISFMNNGEAGIDAADANKLLPLSPSSRVVGLSYVEGKSLDINNLPYESDNAISFPLDVMYLNVNDNSEFVTQEETVTMTWDLNELPFHIAMSLTDNNTGEVFDVAQVGEITFTTVAKGSFSSSGNEAVLVYPQLGNSHFTVNISYSEMGTDNEEHTMPIQYALHQNYPNPFNPITTLRYDIPENSYVTIIIYDMLGRQVKTIINQTQDAGFKTIQWNATNDYGKPVSAGIYLYQIQAGEYISTKKMVLLK